MSTQFDELREMVFNDLSLQAALREIESQDAFVSKVVDLASQNGFPIEREDVEDAIKSGRRGWIEQWI